MQQDVHYAEANGTGASKAAATVHLRRVRPPMVIDAKVPGLLAMRIGKSEGDWVVAYEQEVSFCKGCQEAFYPALFGICPCNGKHRAMIRVGLAEALEISKLREDGNIHVYIREGKLVSSHGPVRKVEPSTSGNGNDPKEIRRREALSDPGGQAAAVSEGPVETGAGGDSNSSDVEGPTEVVPDDACRDSGEKG